MIRVTIYNEYVHEVREEAVKKVYPEGIHMALKKALEGDDITVKTVTLATVEDLTEELLENTDVLIWWGHMAHQQVPDEVVERCRLAILRGMGAIVLHSGHHSKFFKALMATSCNLTWRDDADRELVWTVNPSHPIAKGIGRYIRLEHEETYGEPFGVPEPDELVFIGSYEGGEVFRAGCCYHKEYGKVFYFQPGHESYPTYYNPDVITVLKNAVHWAAPTYRVDALRCPHVKKPLEEAQK